MVIRRSCIVVFDTSTARDEQCRGKLFLNFDDEAFNHDMRRYLEERFPSPSMYEKGGFAPAEQFVSTLAQAPVVEPVSMPASDQRTDVPVPKKQPLPRSRCSILVPLEGHIEPACEETLKELERRGYVARCTHSWLTAGGNGCMLQSARR